METRYVDVLIIGAGVSGIGAGYHLQDKCADKTYAILEARENLGGTWALFRYPGIRSDSDMYTFGYSFKPWTEARSIADGAAILAYLKETASEFGIDRHILYRHRARSAAWSSEKALWTVEVEHGANMECLQYTCRFLYLCAGYYNYAHGHTPNFADRERFAGRIVHPQQWTDDIDYAGKRIVVIGSGATAVTLVPELAKQAAHVTMLQRSPTYMISWPAQDKLAKILRRILPVGMAHAICRWQYVLTVMLFFNLARGWPALVKKCLVGLVRRELGPEYDIGKNFTPRYDPWDQRICLVLDGDFFQAIKTGKASVVTECISSFTEKGIAFESGRELEADLIVTATGLELQMLGGIDISVDGTKVDIGKCLQYKGTMFSGIPNLASCFGYINASWTLKADLINEYLCRLLRHMDAAGMRRCTPELADQTIEPEPFVDFSSGYFQRSADRLPRQGSKRPWKLYQNYALDIALLRFGKIDDGTIVFSNPLPAAQPAPVGNSA
jgi:cation diffusion facilitator CzcD-associated flavoprotein CzcO